MERLSLHYLNHSKGNINFMIADYFITESNFAIASQITRPLALSPPGIIQAFEVRIVVRCSSSDSTRLDSTMINLCALVRRRGELENPLTYQQNLFASLVLA